MSTFCLTQGVTYVVHPITSDEIAPDMELTSKLENARDHQSGISNLEYAKS